MNNNKTLTAIIAASILASTTLTAGSHSKHKRQDPIVGVWTVNAPTPTGPIFGLIVFNADGTYILDGSSSLTQSEPSAFCFTANGTFSTIIAGTWKKTAKRRYALIDTFVTLARGCPADGNILACITATPPCPTPEDLSLPAIPAFRVKVVREWVINHDCVTGGNPGPTVHTYYAADDYNLTTPVLVDPTPEPFFARKLTK